MTLRRFNKNSSVDNRQVEYEQSLVKLGLEVADATRELGRIRGQVQTTQLLRDEVQTEIEEKRKEVEDLKVSLADIQEEIAQAIRSGGVKVAELKEILEEKDGKVSEKEEDLDKLQDYLGSLDHQIQDKLRKIGEFSERIERLHQ